METDLRSLWLGRWAEWLPARQDDLIVCGRSAAAQEIAVQVQAGKLTTSRASSLLGARTAWDEALPAKLYYGGDQQAANQLRKAGIAFSREMQPQARVNLAELLRVAAAAWDGERPAR